VINAPSQYVKEWMNTTIYERYGEILTESYIDLIWSSIVSIFLVGGAIGSLSGSYVANKVGR
jgi:MFS transporter, SP family, solute carrier family 2 (facilitated glucose transporter), member 3